MQCYVGLDVSLKQTSICVVDQTGAVVREGVVDSDPEATPITVRGGGIPTGPLAFKPNGRMDPPLRSFAADAHDCIMVRVLGPTEYKVAARLNRARKRAPL